MAWATAHIDPMTSFWTNTADLLHRREDTLSKDERSSIAHLLAYFDEMDGVEGHSPETQWARVARQIEQYARELGQLPTIQDGASEIQVKWIATQKTAVLSSFQRERLEIVTGWS